MDLCKPFRLLIAPAALMLLTGTNAIGGEVRPLSLSQAIDAALVSNPDLRLSIIALAGADANVELASAKPNPTLSLQTSGINPHLGIGAGPLRGKTVDSTLRVDQLIERGGKRGFRIANAVELQNASASDLHDARRRLRQMVGAAYYDLLAAHDKLRIARANVELFERTVEAAQRRRAAGDLAGADVARAQIDAARARNDADQAESDIVAMRQALLLLVGLDGDIEFVPSDSWPTTQPLSHAGDSAALMRRPDILAAKARLAAARSAQQLARASRHADVTVGIQAEHYPGSTANPQGGGNSYGVALQIPLMVNYAYGGEIRAADAALENASESLDKAIAAARSEALLTRERARAAFERVQRYDDELLPLAMKAAQAAEFAFAHGALGMMDLLDVRRTYRAAQLEALAARADYAKALVTLAAVTWDEGTK